MHQRFPQKDIMRIVIGYPFLIAVFILLGIAYLGGDHGVLGAAFVLWLIADIIDYGILLLVPSTRPGSVAKWFGTLALDIANTIVFLLATLGNQHWALTLEFWMYAGLLAVAGFAGALAVAQAEAEKRLA